MDLINRLAQNNKCHVCRPLVFDLSIDEDRESVQGLFADGRILNIVDNYEEQQRELFAVSHPTKVFGNIFEDEFQAYFLELSKDCSIQLHGRWVYYPWLFTLVHLLEDDDFQRVRFARNRNLITEEEQQQYYESVVGVAGLSVGNSIALAIVLTGGARHLKLADFDQLALSNLNRVRAGVQYLGMKKTFITAQQIYELNPYAYIDIYSEGLSDENIEDFFQGDNPLDVVVDEIDNLAMKYRIREYAKRSEIPVVMAADNGDNGVVDIERYDLDSNLSFFHNRMGDVSYEQLLKMDKFEIGRTIAQHIGPKNVSVRMQESLPEMGKTIVSWPQLGGAAVLNGPAVAYCIRKILNNQPLEDNRAYISLDEKFVPDYHSLANEKQRYLSVQKFKKILKID